VNRTAAIVVSAGSLVGIAIVLLQVSLFRSGLLGSFGAAQPHTSTTIQCSPAEALATHYHVALRLHEAGGTQVIPAGTGIEPSCYYWIHVHDDSGIVHVEAPAAYGDHVFVLGDVFSVARQPLDAHHLGNATYAIGTVAVYVDGRRWSGAPGDVPLVDLRTIDVVAPGEPFTYQAFQWPSGFLPPPAN
jgi:hypothetical protein